VRFSLEQCYWVHCWLAWAIFIMWHYFHHVSKFLNLEWNAHKKCMCKGSESITLGYKFRTIHYSILCKNLQQKKVIYIRQFTVITMTFPSPHVNNFLLINVITYLSTKKIPLPKIGLIQIWIREWSAQFFNSKMGSNQNPKYNTLTHNNIVCTCYCTPQKSNIMSTFIWLKLNQTTPRRTSSIIFSPRSMSFASREIKISLKKTKRCSLPLLLHVIQLSSVTFIQGIQKLLDG